MKTNIKQQIKSNEQKKTTHDHNVKVKRVRIGSSTHQPHGEQSKRQNQNQKLIIITIKFVSILLYIDTHRTGKQEMTICGMDGMPGARMTVEKIYCNEREREREKSWSMRPQNKHNNNNYYYNELSIRFLCAVHAVTRFARTRNVSICL